MTDIIFEKRLPFAAMAIGCAALLGFGYYLQFYKGVEPCPLCIFQRICYFGVAVISLLAAVHGPRGIARIIYGAVALIAASGGAAIAGRQVWLQHLPPDQVPECGPGLEFMLETYPLTDAIARMLRGTGDCAEIKWTFLGLSIPEWSLICFTLIAAAAITQVATAFRVKE
jgi:disulfide bond formation protein DsbB